jgi:hypothetical protein
MQPVDVFLNWTELLMAAIVGVRRNISSMAKELVQKHGCCDRDSWLVHINGACGEMASAKVLGLYWDASVDVFKRSDLPYGIQVRTRSSHSYDLLVRKSDSSDDIFVLVTGDPPSLVVRGWCLGADAKQERFLQNYGNREPAYFIPQSELSDIQQLKELICDKAKKGLH